MVVRSRWLVLAALSCALTAAVASPAAAPARETGPSLRVTRAVVHAPWEEGWLRPGASVRFAGRVGSTAHLTAVLRPLTRPNVVTAEADVDVRGGAFAGSLTLPPRPLPGRYRLNISGTSGKTALKPVGRTIMIASPPEGVVGPALVGTTSDGPWLRYVRTAPVVNGAPSELWARFVFLSPPRGTRVAVVWKRRWRVGVGVVHRTYASTIETYARSAAPLPAGVWNVILKVDGRVAKRMAVRLEPSSAAASGASTPSPITVG